MPGPSLRSLPEHGNGAERERANQAVAAMALAIAQVVGQASKPCDTPQDLGLPRRPRTRAARRRPRIFDPTKPRFAARPARQGIRHRH
eukprot:14076969-Alexandrium_andersonii.AAC.1